MTINTKIVLSFAVVVLFVAAFIVLLRVKTHNPSLVQDNPSLAAEGPAWGVGGSSADIQWEINASLQSWATIEPEPLGFDKAAVLAMQDDIQAGKPQDWRVGAEIVPAKIGTGITYAYLQIFEVCDVRFYKQAVIDIGDARFQFSLEPQNYIREEIIKENPSYFRTLPSSCGDALVWKENNTFYADLVAGKTGPKSREWLAVWNTMLKEVASARTVAQAEAAIISHTVHSVQ